VTGLSGEAPALDPFRRDLEHDAIRPHRAAAPQVREARIRLVKALDQRAPLGAVGQTSVKNLEGDFVFRVY
jgi:hypothetical protein